MHLLHQLKESHVVSSMLCGFTFFSIQILIFNQINVFTKAFETVWWSTFWHNVASLTFSIISYNSVEKVSDTNSLCKYEPVQRLWKTFLNFPRSIVMLTQKVYLWCHLMYRTMFCRRRHQTCFLSQSFWIFQTILALHESFQDE